MSAAPHGTQSDRKGHSPHAGIIKQGFPGSQHLGGVCKTTARKADHAREGTGSRLGILTRKSQQGQDINKKAVAQLKSQKGHHSHAPISRQDDSITLPIPSKHLRIYSLETQSDSFQMGKIKPVKHPAFLPGPLPPLCVLPPHFDTPPGMYHSRLCF